MAGAFVRIGISGWRYEPWRGTFYPQGLPQKHELDFASRELPVIELNGSFYSLQRPTSYAHWAEQTPPGFVFTVKAPRFITHIRRLDDVELPIANFLASGLFELGHKLGPILWQLPPSLKFDAQKLEAFLALLPHTAPQAEALAKKREARMKGRESLKPVRGLQLRHALEVRHESFEDPAFIALLRKYNVAFVVADTGGRWPEFRDVTADFVYVRLHGADELYATGYSSSQLDTWAQRIEAWAHGGRDVYCFFDNTMKLEAPNNARHLLKRFGIVRR